jgi:hypothetical protein
MFENSHYRLTFFALSWKVAKPLYDSLFPRRGEGREAAVHKLLYDSEADVELETIDASEL